MEIVDTSEAFRSSSPYFGSMVAPIAKIIPADGTPADSQPLIVHSRYNNERPPRYLPTPEEIAAGCERAQGRWSKREKKIRSGEPQNWTPPVVKIGRGMSCGQNADASDSAENASNPDC